MIAGAGSLVSIASAIYWGSRVFGRVALTTQVLADQEAASFKEGAEKAKGITAHIKRLVKEAKEMAVMSREVKKHGEKAQESWERGTVVAWLEEHTSAEQIENFLKTEPPAG